MIAREFFAKIQHPGSGYIQSWGVVFTQMNYTRGTALQLQYCAVSLGPSNSTVHTGSLQYCLHIFQLYTDRKLLGYYAVYEDSFRTRDQRVSIEHSNQSELPLRRRRPSKIYLRIPIILLLLYGDTGLVLWYPMSLSQPETPVTLSTRRLLTQGNFDLRRQGTKQQKQEGIAP